MSHGGEYPDTMPQAIKLIDAEGRSCIYVPIMQNGKLVHSQGLCSMRRMNDPARHDPDDEAKSEAGHFQPFGGQAVRPLRGWLELDTSPE
jgi:hypothetical protein